MLDITSVIGKLPYRMALAGGWIDQPFISRLNPEPPGSMVVVALEPVVHFMERAGMATGTRKVAAQLWKGGLPDVNPDELIRELYRAENNLSVDPSGSQDMVGLIYPGVSRLDYDADFEGGYFPKRIECDRDLETARWIEKVIHVAAVNQRPEGYHPLGIRNLNPRSIARLGQSGKDCYAAIQARDPAALGASMNACMECWENILPHTVQHPSICIDLKALLSYYQARYHGAMFSGCGGGYLFVVSTQPVPGTFRVTVRTS